MCLRGSQGRCMGLRSVSGVSRGVPDGLRSVLRCFRECQEISGAWALQGVSRASGGFEGASGTILRGLQGSSKVPKDLSGISGSQMRTQR